jgi:hypothetical protein
VIGLKAHLAGPNLERHVAVAHVVTRPGEQAGVIGPGLAEGFRRSPWRSTPPRGSTTATSRPSSSRARKRLRWRRSQPAVSFAASPAAAPSPGPARWRIEIGARASSSAVVIGSLARSLVDLHGLARFRLPACAGLLPDWNATS